MSAVIVAFLVWLGLKTWRKELSGKARFETARNLWVATVNNHGGFGGWAFLEIADPWDAKNTIRALLVG